MEKKAKTKHQIADLIVRRWSPYAFMDKPIEKEKISQLFEAARWAPSAFNEQPWRFIAADKRDPKNFDKMLSCLVDANQAWAKNSALLLILVVSKNSSYNNEPNRWAAHDCGLALENLLLEAVDLSLAAHPMGGFSPDKVRELYDVPQDFEPLVAIAVGYHAGEETISDELKERELSERERKALSETIFAGKWGDPYQ